MGGGKGEGGEAGEQQIRAPGNPYFSFSSSSFSLCVRRGFDKKFPFRQCRTPGKLLKNTVCVINCKLKTVTWSAYTDIPVPIKRNTGTGKEEYRHLMFKSFGTAYKRGRNVNSRRTKY